MTVHILNNDGYTHTHTHTHTHTPAGMLLARLRGEAAGSRGRGRGTGRTPILSTKRRICVTEIIVLLLLFITAKTVLGEECIRTCSA